MELPVALEIDTVAPEDTDTVASVAAVINESMRVDSPWMHEATLTGLRGALTYGHDGEPPLTWVGRVGGQVAVMGQLNISEWDNRDVGWLGVMVRPGVRRRGYGSQMARLLEQEAARAGRTKLGTDAWDGSVGVAFAEGHGYLRKSQAVLRRQHLSELDPSEVRRLRDRAAQAAAGYELLRLTGRTPEELLEPLAVASASINDAPLDDLDLEDESYEPERVRRYEEVTELRNRTLHRVLARSRDTGEIVGHTAIAVERARPWIAAQGDTTVVPAHRGHRLGMLLKAEMVLWLTEVEPAVETVDTWNAESNTHMVAVNELLGYRWMARELQFQKP